ncbi:hypothetical protein ACL02S_05365 [Nocardia sp. 004]|uniref:hypothetical protein n=1 Tax=Nocardia sp. 004 TaxID=3385978 RepID=UPI0039A36557
MPVSEPREPATVTPSQAISSVGAEYDNPENAAAIAPDPRRTGRAESDRPSTAEPAPGLSSEVEAVVARWNPHGTALLRTVSGSGRGGVVSLFGPPDANTMVLRTELARFEPRIPLSEPIAGLAPAATADSGAAPSAVALILLDAGITVGADLLELIDRLRADRTRILLAMNGIHAYQDWRAVRERDLEVLAGHGAADLDIVPVSARLAAAARATGDAGLLDRSGLAVLHTQLVAAASGTTETGGARQASVTGRVLADTRARVVEQMAALRSGAESARLREERALLLAGRDGGRASAMSALRGGLHLARVDLLTDIGARIRALHADARAELDRLRPAEAGAYPDRLQRAVTELTGAVDHAIDHRLAELSGRITGDEHGAPQRRRDPAPQVGPDPEPRHRGAEDHLMIALGASAGVGLGRLLVAPLSLVPALDVASFPVALLVGGGAAAWVVRARRQLADRAHLRQWVADVLVAIKAQLEQRVATALVETETGLTEYVVQASTTRMLDIDRRVAELEATLRRKTAEQPKQLAACERDIRIIDSWISPVETSD